MPFKKNDDEQQEKGKADVAWELACRDCEELLAPLGKESFKTAGEITCKECGAVNIVPKVLIIWPEVAPAVPVKPLKTPKPGSDDEVNPD